VVSTVKMGLRLDGCNAGFCIARRGFALSALSGTRALRMILADAGDRRREWLAFFTAELDDGIPSRSTASTIRAVRAQGLSRGET